ncbi:MAG TPA: hypothetical protein VJ487_08140 [Alphaproteobacteria bacterium]|nr:hypothetical protein [Alphaproteobacteria bacterium]
MAKKVEPREERLQLMLDREELHAIEDWRFRMRMPSRSAAVRELIRRGLLVEADQVETLGKHSRDFGITRPGGGRRRGPSSEGH